MKKKLLRGMISATMIAAMMFSITACGTEQSAVAETPVVTENAPAKAAVADTAEKEKATEPVKETEAKATEVTASQETEAGMESETATEETTETEKEAAVTEGSPLVGEWSLEMFVFKFFEDGTGDYVIAGSSMPFTYEDHGDSVFVQFDGDSNGEEHKYRIEGDTLYFEDSMGEEVEYKR